MPTKALALCALVEEGWMGCKCEKVWWCGVGVGGNKKSAQGQIFERAGCGQQRDDSKVQHSV